MSLGYRTFWYKLLVFMTGAAMAGIAGTLYATYMTYIDPTSFTLNESIFILTVVIFGGLANLNGSVLGAALLTVLPEALRAVGFPEDSASQLRMMTYGLLLILLMRYRPQGMIGEYRP